MLDRCNELGASAGATAKRVAYERALEARDQADSEMRDLLKPSPVLRVLHRAMTKPPKRKARSERLGGPVHFSS